MAKESFTGPLIALGGLVGGQSYTQPGTYGGVNVGGPKEYSDEIGPSIFWGGVAIPASGAVVSKDRTGSGTISSIYAAFPIRTVNAILAVSAGALTVAGPALAGVPLVNLATYAAGRSPGVPVTVSGVATTGVAIDTGIDTATWVAATGVCTLGAPSVAANTWRYQVGQWVCLLNGGASGAARMTQITAIGTGTITVSPLPASNATGQIALTNRFNPNLYGTATPPSSISSMAAAGTARILIPECGNTRGIGILGSASGVATIFDVVGIGAFGQIQTETITGPVGALTTYSKKTYDMIISVTPRTSDAHNYTVNTSDIIGLPLSVMDASSLVAVSLGGTAAVAGTNFIVIPADLTNPPVGITTTGTSTGDPRGAIQVGAAGPAATTPGTPMAAFNGTLVLAIDQRLNPLQVALATTINPGPLAGVATV
jgi:hypothetical protein